MKIDLSGYDKLYTSNELELSNQVSYIFGKNGAGKSTLTKLIKEQLSEEYDVCVFQGFESVVGSNENLDAVALGEENTEIQKLIANEEEQIRILQSAIYDEKAKIQQPVDPDTVNLWTEQQVIERSYKKAEKDLEDFYKNAAKEIKYINNPSVASPSYNKSHFQKDIPNAVQISDDEKEQCKKILLSDVKTAPSISFPVFDLKDVIENINELLKKTVEKKTIVGRIEGNPEKQKFARMGLEIHKPGDVCAFCGNLISNNAFQELGSFFSVDEMKSFEREIKNYCDFLNTKKEDILRVKIETDNFYPGFKANVDELKSRLLESQMKYSEIIGLLANKLTAKLSSLVDSLPGVTINDELPESMERLGEFYKHLVLENNKSDLKTAQLEAMDKLRLDAVALLLKENGFNNLKTHITEWNTKLEGKKKEIESVIGEIARLEDGIKTHDDNISRFLAQTKNEKKLARNINKKLQYLVNFELEHFEDYDHKGYYRIKDCATGEHRSVKNNLSTGEKNIIAFLYFIEKLKEVNGKTTNKPRIIVFDDPMSSNDDDMIYLMTQEIQQMKYSLRKTDDKMVILTHNVAFFTEVKNAYDEDFYKDNTVVRLSKNPYGKTDVIIVKSLKDDVKSSYAGLWKNLKSIYEMDGLGSDALLNPMRRIIDFYIALMGNTTKRGFCRAEPQLGQWINPGSHSSVDMIPVTSITKRNLLKMFCNCFCANGIPEHVNHYWGEINICKELECPKYKEPYKTHS